LLALVNLGARLTNDKSLKCRRMITLATRKLFESVSESRLNDVYLAMRDWLEAKKEQSRSIAMQMLVEMAEVRNEIVSNKLNELLPYVTQTVQPNILSEYTEMNITKIIDSLTALIRKCESAAKQAANSGLFDEILKHLEDFAKCLESPAIQLASARLLGQLFAALELNFFRLKESPSVKELIDWTCWQLKNRSLGDDLAEQNNGSVDDW
uniref:Small subunit processome component 20 homolog (inferred by orthology to a human protein) n=1 Tax=Anisakis simplex TaxID=6269 RepID=A0A0M3J7V2_ANISI